MTATASEGGKVQPRRRLLRRALLLLCLGIAAALTVLALRLPDLLDARIRKELEPWGVERLVRGESSWGLNGAGIARLEFWGHYEGREYTAVVEDFRALYRWQSLIGGEIGAIGIGRLDARFGPATDTQPVLLAEWLRSLSTTALPVATLEIGELSLNIATAEDSLQLDAEDLRADREARQLLGRLRIVSSTLPAPVEALLVADDRLAWIPRAEIRVLDGDRLLLGVRLRFATFEATDSDERVRIELEGDAKLLGTDLSGFDSTQEPLPDTLSIDTRLGGSLLLPAAVPDHVAGWLRESTLNGELQFDAREQSIPAVGILEPALHAKGAVKLDEGELSFTPSTPLTLHAELDPAFWQALGECYPWSKPMAIAGEVASDDPLLLSLGEDSAEPFDAPRLEIELASEEAQQRLRAAITLTRATLRDDEWALDGNAALSLPCAARDLPRLEVDFNGATRQGSWRGKGSFAAPHWHLQGEWKAATGSDGSLRADASARLATLAQTAKTLQAERLWPRELSLASGSALLEIGWRGAGAGSMSVELAAKDISGLYAGVAFSDASLSASLVHDARWRAPRAFELRVPALSSGVEITELRLSARPREAAELAKARWLIDDFRARLFSGEVKLSEAIEIGWPFSGETPALELAGVVLDDILRLYADQGLGGNGVLNGRVPLRLDADGVHVRDAWLRAAPPGGTIVYHSPELESGVNRELALTLRLLRDFRYAELVAGADFEPDGSLLLKLALSGKNPAEFGGKLVNFNIKVEENLYQLFRVLRLEDELSRKIEERLQRRDAPGKKREETKR